MKRLNQNNQCNLNYQTLPQRKYTADLIKNINFKILELSQKLTKVKKLFSCNKTTQNNNQDLNAILLQVVNDNLNKLEDLSHVVYIGNNLIDSITQNSISLRSDSISNNTEKTFIG